MSLFIRNSFKNFELACRFAGLLNDITGDYCYVSTYGGNRWIVWRVLPEGRKVLA